MLFKLNCYGPPAYFDTKFPTLSEARQVLAGEDLWDVASLGVAIAVGVARARETLHCGGGARDGPRWPSGQGTRASGLPVDGCLRTSCS